MPLFHPLFREKPIIRVFDVDSFQHNHAYKLPHPPLKDAMVGLTKQQKEMVLDHSNYPFPAYDHMHQFSRDAALYAMINELHRLNQRRTGRHAYAWDALMIFNLINLFRLALYFFFRCLGP